MMWPFSKPKRKTDAAVEEEQRRSDRARHELDAVHRRLEEAVNGLMAPKAKASNND